MSKVRRSYVLSRFVIGLCACACAPMVLLSAGDAQAQAKKKPTKADRNAARSAYEAATAAFDKGDYVTALEQFTKANELIPAVQAQYRIAVCMDKLGRRDDTIKAYQDLLASPDAKKLGDDKLDDAKQRLASLQADAAQPESDAQLESETKPEPKPEPAAEPEPELTPPPETPKPQRKYALAEVGLLGGPLFVSSSHNLQAGSSPHAPYASPVWTVGLRAAFFPAKALGIEAEYAHGFGSVEAPDDASIPPPDPDDFAGFNILRAHLIGQVANSRFVPFFLLGVGMLQADSKRLGADADLMFDAGLGAKFFATKLIVPRLDLRLDVTQKQGGGFSDGLTFNPEILLGVSFALGH